MVGRYEEGERERVEARCMREQIGPKQTKASKTDGDVMLMKCVRAAAPAPPLLSIKN
jgi:hypothetical protein